MLDIYDICAIKVIMPYRRFPHQKDGIYHIYNRSIANQPVFVNFSNFQRCLDTINYYRFHKPKMSYSCFSKLTLVNRKRFLEELNILGNKQVEIYAFCLMPTHFHLLLREVRDNGISDFMRIFQNSYAKYFNKKTGRFGAVFQSMYKSETIYDNNSIVNVIKYIHNNPKSLNYIRTEKDLKNYLWGSLPDYLNSRKSSFIAKDSVLASLEGVFEDIAKNKWFY